MFLRPTEVIQFLREKKYILPEMKGADFGCGSGYFTSLLAKEVGINGLIYAIDVQEDALKEAQEFLKNLQIKNVKFLKQDLEISSGLVENSLDFVFISQVLYQSDQPDKIIKNAYLSLKKGGYLIILEPKESALLFQGQRVYNKDVILEHLIKENFDLVSFKEFGDYYLLVAVK